jgi:hypothetical protein
MANKLAEFVITVMDDQSVKVVGPIDSKMLTMGMFEMAKEAVLKYHDKKGASAIIEPPAGMSALLRP